MADLHPYTDLLSDGDRTLVVDGLEVTLTRSEGDDKAILVIIDTHFEPNGSDGSPGLRVLVNDEPVLDGKNDGISYTAPAEPTLTAVDDV